MSVARPRRPVPREPNTRGRAEPCRSSGSCTGGTIDWVSKKAGKSPSPNRRRASRFDLRGSGGGALYGGGARARSVDGGPNRGVDNHTCKELGRKHEGEGG